MNKYQNLSTVVLGPTIVSNGLSLTELLTVDQLSSVQRFKYFRFNAVSFRLIPRSNIVGTGTTTSVAVTYPNIYTLFESNPDVMYTSLTEIINNPRAKLSKGIRGFSRFAKLVPTHDVTMGTGTNVTVRMPNKFISTANVSAQLGRFIFIDTSAATNDVAITYDFLVTCYVSLKELIIPNYAARKIPIVDYKVFTNTVEESDIMRDLILSDTE